MKYHEGFFDGVRGSQIYHQSWTPDGEAKAALLLVHGLAEHSGRYMNIIDHFVPLDYAVYGIDHLGHGKSDGRRVFVQSFDDYSVTLEIFLAMLRTWQPGKQIFMVGHSMGGLIAPLFALTHQDDLAGLIISAPLSKVPEYISPLIVAVGRVLSAILPTVGIQDIDADGVSRDPAVVKAYDEDPLVYRGKTTARLAAELLAAMQQLQIDAAEIKLPVLVMQGSMDKLVDPDCAHVLHNALGSEDKTLKVYPGLFHEIFNEPERDQVFADMQTWLEAHF
jgi:alpha-beta hydrolase superfamily lysophospholipase